MEQNKRNINKLTMLGMMTALVFVSNYLRVTMPIAPAVPRSAARVEAGAYPAPLIYGHPKPGPCAAGPPVGRPERPGLLFAGK